MSMEDIRTEIRFGASAAVTRDQIKQAKFNILNEYLYRAGEEMGRKIAEAKQWSTRHDGNIVFNTLSVYVFTGNELHDYVDAKIKDKLIEMSERKETPDDIGRWLKILSERV